MRSFILILATLGIIAGGFLIYWLLQPAAPPVQLARPPLAGVAPASRPAGVDGQAPSVIGPGEGAWVKQFDAHTGELRNQFRGAHFNPTDDGTVVVARPEAEFFLSDGQYLRLRGDSGVVVMDLPDISQQQQMRSIGTRPPRRGELQNVTIELFKNARARRPMLTLELPNAEFDNEMFRISTRAYERDGKTIPADRVPVKVRGSDYDFDGSGLTIRWNERDQRLELLEIAHGGRLMLKHPDRFGVEDRRAARTTPAMFAEAGASAVAENLADKGDLYRATFSNDVRITQSQQELARAETLHVSFRLKDASPDDTPATSTAPAPRDESADAPSTRPRGARSDESAPITIVWSGPLRLAPRDDAPERRIAAGEALVQLAAEKSPVVISQNAQRIECATVFYETGSATFHAESSDVQRVRLTDPKGAVIETQSMSFSADRAEATLNGASRAELPIEAEGRRETLVAQWSQTCVLTLGDSQDIRTAQLNGTVSVRHPQLDLKSNALELEFDDKQTGNSNLSVRTIAAAGAVDCRLKDPSSPDGDRQIQCNTLKLATETDGAGRLYPRQIDAAGDVLAADATQQIHAGRLSLSLSPATQPDGQVELSSFLAEHEVRISTADGAAANADQIVADDRRIKLIGQPARVSDATTALEGPIIEIKIDEKTSSVLGKGSLRLAQRPATSGAASTGGTPQITQPIFVNWTQGATLDGAGNRIDVTGGVSIQTSDAESGDITAVAQRMQLSLSDQPHGAPANGDARADEHDRAIAWNFDFLQNKQVSSVELIDDVRVASVLTSTAGGELLRRMTLQAPKIVYTLDDGSVLIPAAGRMLYEDYAPPSQTADPRVPGGATAFAWTQQMRYDDAARSATMSGAVAIVHQPLSGEQRFRLDADEVVAELQPLTDASSQPSLGAAQASFNIQRLIARGDLLFTGNDMELTARTIEYDPNTHWLVGRGEERSPAEVTQRLNSFSAEELWINTQTGDIRFSGASGTIR